MRETPSSGGTNRPRSWCPSGHHPGQVCSAFAQRGTSAHVLMVRPSNFAPNALAASDNHFMAMPELFDHALRELACQQFDSLVGRLRQAGVVVEVVDPEPGSESPDAVFPNNVFSTHSTEEVGCDTLVLYPMRVENRRIERDLLRPALERRQYERVIDLTHYERQGRYLESTGSLVLDRDARTAFMCRSNRADPDLAASWAEMLGYEIVPFDATDDCGRSIYHTNVMMSVGHQLAVICSEAISARSERRAVLRRLTEHHEVIEVSREQAASFCCNVIQLGDIMVMSTRAFDALSSGQKGRILAYVQEIVHAPLDTIEIGGGSARCCIAELFGEA